MTSIVSIPTGIKKFKHFEVPKEVYDYILTLEANLISEGDVKKLSKPRIQLLDRNREWLEDVEKDAVEDEA